MANLNIDTELSALDRQLGRLRRRAAQLRRGMQQGTDQWTAWSSTLDEAFGLVDRMMRVSADGSLGLSIKISAVVWFLEETDAVLDAQGMRQLRALVTEARRLARQ